MKKSIITYLLLINSIYAIEFNYFIPKKIILDNGKEYNIENYRQAKGKGIITYEHISVPPFEYNEKNGKFEFNEQDIKMGFTMNYFAQYKGEIKNGEKNGEGTFILNSIDELKYVGNWKDDKPNGIGVLSQSRTGFYYEGNFKNGRKDGLGKIHYSNIIYLNSDGTNYSSKYDETIFFNEQYAYKTQIGIFSDNVIKKINKCFLTFTSKTEICK